MFSLNYFKNIFQIPVQHFFNRGLNLKFYKKKNLHQLVWCSGQFFKHDNLLIIKYSKDNTTSTTYMIILIGDLI
jgi:hypothetical protein